MQPRWLVASLPNKLSSKQTGSGYNETKLQPTSRLEHLIAAQGDTRHTYTLSHLAPLTDTSRPSNSLYGFRRFLSFLTEKVIFCRCALETTRRPRGTLSATALPRRAGVAARSPTRDAVLVPSLRAWTPPSMVSSIAFSCSAVARMRGELLDEM